jgi:hypothetical protein
VVKQATRWLWHGSSGGKDSKEVIDHKQAAAGAMTSKVVHAQSVSEESV